MAEDISKQDVEGEPWFLLTLHSKMQERNDSDIISNQKKKAKLKNLEHSQPIHTEKSESLFMREQGVHGQRII